MNSRKNIPTGHSLAIMQRQLQAAPKASKPAHPVAPAVYRPQPIPKVLQTKKNAPGPLVPNQRSIKIAQGVSSVKAGLKNQAVQSLPSRVAPQLSRQPQNRLIQSKPSALIQMTRDDKMGLGPTLPRKKSAPSASGLTKTGRPDKRTSLGKLMIEGRQQKSKITGFFAPPPVVTAPVPTVPASQTPIPPPVQPPQIQTPLVQPPVAFQQVVLPGPPPPGPSVVIHAPQVQQNLAPVMQRSNPGDLMDRLETKVVIGGAIAGMQKLAFCVEGEVSNVYSVSTGGHTEENAASDIGNAIAAFINTNNRPPDFLCVYSTNSPCYNYTAEGSKTMHNCSRLLADLPRYNNVGSCYLRFRSIWEGDGSESKKAITRQGSQIGLRLLKDRGWNIL